MSVNISYELPISAILFHLAALVCFVCFGSGYRGFMQGAPLKEETAAEPEPCNLQLVGSLQSKFAILEEQLQKSCNADEKIRLLEEQHRQTAEFLQSQFAILEELAKPSSETVKITETVGKLFAYIWEVETRIPRDFAPNEEILSLAPRSTKLHSLFYNNSLNPAFCHVIETTAGKVIKHYLNLTQEQLDALGIIMVKDDYDEIIERDFKEYSAVVRNGMSLRQVSGKPHPIICGGAYIASLFYDQAQHEKFNRENSHMINTGFPSVMPNPNQNQISQCSIIKRGNSSLFTPINSGWYNHELNTISPWETDEDYALRVLRFIEDRARQIVKIIHPIDNFNLLIAEGKPYKRQSWMGNVPIQE